MRRTRVTSFDVAEAAGVSQSTVSRALAGSPSITEETRARVEAAAASLGAAVRVLFIGARPAAGHGRQLARPINLMQVLTVLDELSLPAAAAPAPAPARPGRGWWSSPQPAAHDGQRGCWSSTT